MNIEQAILNNLRVLPLDKQQLIAKTPIISPQEQANNWKQWAESHQRPSPGLSDAAISRESIYS